MTGWQIFAFTAAGLTSITGFLWASHDRLGEILYELRKRSARRSSSSSLR